ncbi:MAG TPA: hypothetical protein VE861_01040, partial [Gemmatimonadaceae bacterium]|nr:hypothetical protein [Gemmatimonadaceae bacterium]
GEPAAVLAYRWGDRVLLHYTVSEQFLFQSSAVRIALAAQRPARLGDGPRHALAWAQAEAGALLVGEVDGEALAAAFAAAVPRATALSAATER